MLLSIAELEKLLTLARRDYYGTVTVMEGSDKDGLLHKQVTVFLTDMGTGDRKQQFKLSPRGLLNSTK